MPQATDTHSTPARRSRRGTDAAFFAAAAAYRAALAKLAVLDATPLGQDRADVEAHDDRCAAASAARYDALADAVAAASNVTTAAGRQARARLFLRAIEDMRENEGEVGADDLEMMLAVAIARDAIAAV